MFPHRRGNSPTFPSPIVFGSYYLSRSIGRLTIEGTFLLTKGSARVDEFYPINFISVQRSWTLTDYSVCRQRSSSIIVIKFLEIPCIKLLLSLSTFSVRSIWKKFWMGKWTGFKAPKQTASFLFRSCDLQKMVAIVTNLMTASLPILFRFIFYSLIRFDFWHFYHTLSSTDTLISFKLEALI